MVSLIKRVKNIDLTRIIDRDIFGVHCQFGFLSLDTFNGFSETKDLIILWQQNGEDVVRLNWWKKSTIKIFRK